MHIDESTHIQLIHIAETLANELRAIHGESGIPMRYDRIAKAEKALDLANYAKIQAKAAGIPVGDIKAVVKAEDLPDGTKFILGGAEYERRHATSANGWVRTSPRDGVLSWCYFSLEAVQELIDRGVRFEIPKGGA